MIRYINYGAADGVTGSCHMISTDYGNVLLDCGLFQGRDKKIYSNLEMYFNPSHIDAIVLSHAHIDHCGRIPILYKLGYRGKVYGTKATKLLCEILLEESSKMFEEFSGETYRLFDMEDVQRFLDNYIVIDYKKNTKILDKVFVELFDAGHLLGSASMILTVKDKKIFYSGDIGKPNTPILRDPEKVEGADYAIVESTYGSLERHESNEFFDEFENIVLTTLKKHGKCIIPSATVGKMQEVLYFLNEIYEKHNLKYKVYIDSPMSSKIIEIYEKCKDLYDEEALEKLNNGDDPLNFTNLNYLTTKEESINIQESKEPYIVLAAGGMCEGGRIVYHLKKHISDSNSSVILLGNQAQGTLGWRLSKGNKKKQVKISQEKFDVKAKVYEFPSLSGHGDRSTIVEYVCSMKKRPSKIFLVHGERKSQMDLREHLNFKNVEYTKFLKRYELK